MYAVAKVVIAAQVDTSSTAVICLTTHRSGNTVRRTFNIEYITSDFIPIIKQTNEVKANSDMDTCAAITPLNFIADVAWGTAVD